MVGQAMAVCVCCCCSAVSVLGLGRCVHALASCRLPFCAAAVVVCRGAQVCSRKPAIRVILSQVSQPILMPKFCQPPSGEEKCGFNFESLWMPLIVKCVGCFGGRLHADCRTYLRGVARYTPASRTLCMRYENGR